MTKGHSLRQALATVWELAGPARSEQFNAALSPELRDQIQGRLLSAGWYPIDWLAEIYGAAIPIIREEPNLPHLVGRIAIGRDMKGIYKFLTKFVSPGFLAQQTPRILGTYFKGPQIETALQQPQHVEKNRIDGGCKCWSHAYRDGTAKSANSRTVRLPLADTSSFPSDSAWKASFKSTRSGCFPASRTTIVPSFVRA